MALITRITGNNPKGSELTYQEMDGNFIYLENLGLSGSYFATTGSNKFSGNQIITGSLAQGYNVSASNYAHAEGFNTVAAFAYSHAEGINTTANNYNSHAEGQSTIASGLSSHAEGNQSQAIGNVSHAEGLFTIASGSYSHAEGIYTIAQGYGQTVVGQYNKANNTSSLFVIGNGSTSSRQDLARFDPVTIAFSGSLLLDVSVSQSFNLVAGTGYVDGYVQMNVQNTNTGSSASSDLVATADIGTESTYYVDLGINSSKYTGVIGSASDAYLYNTGSDLWIGNITPGKSVKFFASSSTANSYIMSVSSSQVIVMPNVSASLNFANDTAAAAGGVPKGGLYRSGSFVLIRLV
jgi:hypothetical protein